MGWIFTELTGTEFNLAKQAILGIAVSKDKKERIKEKITVKTDEKELGILDSPKRMDIE